MKRSKHRLIALLTILSLLIAMSGYAFATTTSFSDPVSNDQHHLSSENDVKDQSPCCDHDCQCDTMNSGCGSETCKCAVSGSSGFSATVDAVNFPASHGKQLEHSTFAVITCDNPPDNPPPGFS